MKKPNIIWITIDGVRPHSRCKDEFDYPHAFTVMAKECMEFKKVVTSAPSTIMSVSSMMASYPAFYLSRTFYSFNFDKNKFDSLPQILKKQGYNVYGIIAYHEIRKFLSGFFGDFCKKYWPKKINPFVYAWTGEEVNQIVFNLLKKRIKKPFFLYVHYRKLPFTSKNVLKLISKLKKLNLYKDSIFILSSDHGYSDTGPDSKLKGIVTSHDMNMDEDSLYVPLLIKYPGSPIGKVHKHISTLDTTPTIVDLLGMDSSKFKFKGVNYLDLIKNETKVKRKNKPFERYFRTDNRYIFQPSRVTSIKKYPYKYIFSYESKKEDFYDIKNDPLEKNNLIRSGNIFLINEINQFRKEFESQEKEALKFHEVYLSSKLNRMAKKMRDLRIRNIYLPPIGSDLFKDILERAIRKEFIGATINNKK